MNDGLHSTIPPRRFCPEYARAGATGGQFSDLAGRAVPLYRRAAGDASDHQHRADSAGSRQRTTAPGIVPACGAAAFYGAAGADLSAECVMTGTLALPWDAVETEHLLKLCDALRHLFESASLNTTD